jgi:hypothetical protein
VSLIAGAANCGDPSSSFVRDPTQPPSTAANFQPIIHTLDGRHLRFAAGGFQPSVVEHCREDGRRYATSIFQLTAITPMGQGESLCLELSGRVQRLELSFLEAPAQKVSLHCVEGCVVPGGYYPPLNTDVRVPWSQIVYIEFRRN